MVYMYEEIFGSLNNAVTQKNVGNGAAIGVVLTLLITILSTLINFILRDKKLEF